MPAFHDAEKMTPEEAYEQLEQAQQWMDADRCNEALDLAETCLNAFYNSVEPEGIFDALVLIQTIFQNAGDLSGARPYLEEAVAFSRQTLGEEHPETARFISLLGVLLDKCGDYAGAKAYYEKALSINLVALGEEDPETATCLNNLGYILQAMGNPLAARDYYEQIGRAHV